MSMMRSSLAGPQLDWLEVRPDMRALRVRCWAMFCFSGADFGGKADVAAPAPIRRAGAGASTSASWVKPAPEGQHRPNMSVKSVFPADNFGPPRDDPVFGLL